MRLTVLLLIVAFSVAYAESPEVIYPKTKIIQSHEWYARQAELWKNSIGSASTQADWVNYYTASRYSNADDLVLGRIVTEMENAIPQSSALYFVKAWHEGFSPSAYEYILKAHALDPTDALSFPLLVLHHEFNFNPESRNFFSEKIYGSGMVSNMLLNYSYNVLMSLQPNAVLFTDSDNTTIPIFMLQDAMGIRKDVTVLNLDMMLDAEYRNRKLRQHKLSLDLGDDLNQPISKSALCALLPTQNTTHTFYYALTLGKENIASIKDQLYVVGLASQLSQTRLDNMSILKDNMENRFLLDHLTVDFNGESEYAAGRVLSANYLVPMLLLNEHYISTGEVDKSKQLERLVLNLAEQSGKSVFVTNFLNRNKDNGKPFVPYKLDIKAIEGKLKQVKGNVYANQYEVTNAEYNAFLKYLQDNSRDEVYKTSKVQLDQYVEPALSFMKSYHTTAIPTKKNKYFTEYPVVNVTYEAALAYCDWLTTQYNNTVERKYKKVIFRLPSIDEWQVASAGIKDPVSWKLAENKAEVKIYEGGKVISRKYETKMVSLGDADILYPWFKHYMFRNTVLNHKGCSLGNFKFPENQNPCRPDKMSTPDGFWMMSSTGAYFPNDIGLYDVVGNVAEMTNDKGKACGGSWNHAPEESTIKSINTYEGPEAHIGFRIFMEVLEQ